MKRFQNWSIGTKVMSISMLTIAIIMAGMIFYYIPLLKNKLMGEKRTALKDYTEIVYTLVNSYETKVKSGELKADEAKQRALANIKALRYSEGEYFFIMDGSGKMVMHPIKPELDGKDMINEKDPEGKYLFRDMAQTGKEKGEGYVAYMWPKAGNTKPVPKISFVKYVKHLDWVMGTGIYVDDVQAETSKLQWQIIIATILCAVVIMF
ncbi:MAG TPA: cache domain-containing protein, partial [Syntrophorhabdaceae bacterium]|nr:cache domain-containing protein [Syntrophorhabdaceae bacterium]